MGSPLGPLFANAFMTHFEQQHMAKLKQLGVNMWLRFVDDIFATIPDKNNSTAILQHLNKSHPNIKFIVEHEKNCALPFLDTLVKRGGINYYTTIYRKQTFTGVYFNWTTKSD